MWHSGLRIWCCLCSVTGSIPGLPSGLRIRCGHSCGVGCSCNLDSIPGLGTSIFFGCSQKKKKLNHIAIVKIKQKYIHGNYLKILKLYTKNSIIIIIFTILQITLQRMNKKIVFLSRLIIIFSKIRLGSRRWEKNTSG